MSEAKGIGDGAPAGWVLEEYKIPLESDLESILESIRSILKQGKVQSVHLSLGKPIVYTKLVRVEESTQKRVVEEEGSMQLGEVARNVQMEEYWGSKTSAEEIFLDMLLGLEARRLHLAYIGVGQQTRFFDWIGVDKVAYGGIEYLGGAQLVRDGSIPDETIIFFGSPSLPPRVDQVTYAIKCYMFLKEADLPESD